MFACPKCDTLASEVKFLRKANEKMTDRLMAIADARAFEAVKFSASSDGDYYGDGNDEYVSYNKFGDKVLLVKAPKDPKPKEIQT